jgi:DNA helicase-2/ATP-dependent DNA helicase PcrA
MLERRETALEAENRAGNIDELIAAAAESEERGETIAEFLDRASLSSELDHLNPNARVSLMTLHSAKGLEFDVVFLAGMEEGLFPHSQSSGSEADLEEERRLCYVGITRARKKLFVTWTPFRKTYGPEAGFPAQPSRFLKEMPAELVEGLDELDAAADDQQPWGRFSEHPAARRTMFARGEAQSPRKGAAGNRSKPLPQPKSIAELKEYLAAQTKGTSSVATSSAPAGTGATGLRSGMRVRHEQFGDGIILSRERMGNDFKLVITFSRVGRKSLVERFAKLKAL